MKISKKIRYYADQISNTIKINKIEIMIYLSIFIAGLIIGIILNIRNNIDSSSIKYDNNLFCINETGFFSYFVKLSFFLIKTIIFCLLFSIVKKGYYLLYLIPLCKGVEYAKVIFHIIDSHGILSIIFIIFSLISYFWIIMIGFSNIIYLKSHQSNCLISDKLTILFHAKFNIIIGIFTIIFAFLLTSVFFLAIKPIFH